MKKIILLILLLSFSTFLFAQDERTWRASIGVGAAFKKNNRIDNQYEHFDKKIIIRPIPFIEGSVGRLSLGAQGISIRAIGNQLMSVSAFIKREGDRYQGIGMMPRKDSQFVGLSAKFLNYGLSVSHDISGRSHGNLVNANYGTFFLLSEGLVLRPGISLEWADDRYAEYYYSVRKTEATATRSEHHLNNYLQPGVNSLLIYKLSPKWSQITGAGIKLIPKHVRNSPTMNGDVLDIGGFVGVSYSL